MDVDKAKRTKSYMDAEQTLPKELHGIFEQLVLEYQFASLKHHGRPFSSPKVIAELVKMGWRSPPIS
jgi:hypothetical protein